MVEEYLYRCPETLKHALRLRVEGAPKEGQLVGGHPPPLRVSDHGAVGLQLP